jgi:branched-chain amino acid transport system permease protein
VSIPFAGVLGAIAGLLIGLPTFRLRGHYFALAMLAYPLALLYLFEWLGFWEVTIPMVRVSPAAYMQFSDGRVYTLLALGMVVAMMLLTQYVERARFGMALIAIKQNEAAAEAIGIDTLRWKLLAICLSAAVASFVGAFYSVVLLVVTPQSVFGLLVSAQALTVAMFGGIGTVWGPVIGAVALVPLSEALHAEFGSRLPGIQGVVYGLAIIAVVLAAPDGVFWKLKDLFRRHANQAQRDVSTLVASHAAEPAPAAGVGTSSRRSAAAPQGEVILEARGISKSFGGLKAVQEVSFKVHKGSILGIIGPNGAGKTTLFNLLNGFAEPDAGEVMVFGRNMVGRKPHVLCRAGVGRTFQVMRPFARMSVAQNVLVGAYAHAKNDAEARRLTARAMQQVGLSGSASRIAAELTTKELRLMELARSLATQPKILLLDEPLAGLGHSEVGDVIAVVRRLADDGITIVIIEHTMNAMVRLVDRFLVLDHGQVLVEGLPEPVTRDQRVVEAYLGKKWAAAHA